MSSLAATQADGYYVPPEYYESGSYRKKSKNQWYAEQKQKGDKGSSSKKNQGGHNQYEQNGVVRFELPYKGICNGCKNSIGKGTRYNAKKIKTNRKYFTTPIYEFYMTCRHYHCKQEFVICTNPQEFGFDYLQGIKIMSGMVEDDDAVVATEQQQQPKEGSSKQSDNNNNPLQRLESIANGKRKVMLSDYDQLVEIQKMNSKSYFNDADNNAIIRSKFRIERNDKKKRIKEGIDKFGWASSINAASGRRIGNIELQPNSKQDLFIAHDTTTYGNRYMNEKQRFYKARTSSIFRRQKDERSSKRKRRREVKLEENVIPDAAISSSSCQLSLDDNNSSANVDVTNSLNPKQNHPVKEERVAAAIKKTKIKINLPHSTHLGSTFTSATLIAAPTVVVNEENKKADEIMKQPSLSPPVLGDLLACYGSEDSDSEE